MRNQLLTLIALVGCFFFTHGLTGQANFQAGLNSASIRVSLSGLSFETSSTVGFHAGLNYRNRISNKFFLTPGILFSQKGAKIEDLGSEATLKLTYVDIPIMITYQANEEKGFFAEGGPYLGLLLSASSEGEDQEGYKSTDFGIGLGLGYDFGQFLLGLRGCVGISNIGEEGDTGFFGDVSTTNSVGQLFGAYKF